MPTTAIEEQQYKALQGQFNVDELLGVVECFVAGIGNKDSVGDIIVPGAFTESLKRRKPRVVWGHNWNEPIGKVLEMYEVPPSDARLPMKMRAAGIGGLYAKVQFNLKSERGRQAFADVAFFGEEQEWSIGYKTLDADFDPQRQANILKKVELYEASPVLHGANQLTGTISIKSTEASLKGDYPSSNEPDDSVPALKPELGRQANLAEALARKFGGAIRIREQDANSVVFDHRNETGQGTLRVSYHFENGLFMFGDPTRVKPTTVFLAMDADNIPSGSDAQRRFEDRYDMEDDPQIPVGVKPKSPEKADPLGGLVPQELVTGDILHGHGPRRGNLEKLLRYWRPIMKKDGGFRRCRVILADHPELYPLNNICSWLHHETTGLWPNEGCHHPTMKNCRKKLKKIANGSIWSDSQWNERLTHLGDGKSLVGMSEDEIKTILDMMSDDEKAYSMMEQLASRMGEQAKPVVGDMQTVPGETAKPDPELSAEQELPDFETDDEDLAHEKAYMALKDFMNSEPDFISNMTDDSNWVMEGEDEDGNIIEKPLMNTGGDCGCGGDGNDPKQMIGMLMAAIHEMMGKDDSEDIEVKAGRVISTRNMAKLQNAFNLLKDVLSSGGMASDVEAKSLLQSEDFVISSGNYSLYQVKELLDPVFEHYEIKSEVTEDGVKISLSDFSEEAIEALINVLEIM